MGHNGKNQGVPSFLEALWENKFSCLFQLLQASQVPVSLVPSIFKARNSWLSLLTLYPFDTDASASLFHRQGPLWKHQIIQDALYFKVRWSATFIPLQALLCNIWQIPLIRTWTALLRWRAWFSLPPPPRQKILQVRFPVVVWRGKPFWAVKLLIPSLLYPLNGLKSKELYCYCRTCRY